MSVLEIVLLANWGMVVYVAIVRSIELDKVTNQFNHYKISTSGLWCIDKDPKTVDHEFIKKNSWQLGCDSRPDKN